MIAPEALNTILADVLARLCACLEADSTNGKPSKCFVSHNRPPDDCGDYLAVWMMGLYNALNTDGTESPKPQACGDLRGMRVRAKLVRECWPTIENNPTNPFPGVDKIQVASEALLIDANVMACCMENFMLKTNHEALALGISGGRIESILPDDNRGGLAGWTMQFVLTIPGCC